MARAKKENTPEQKPFEQILWSSDDKLRKNIDVENKYHLHELLVLIYNANAFEELHLST